MNACGTRVHRGIAAAILVAIAWMAPPASAGFGGDGGFADLEVSLSGPAGPIPKGQTADYTAVVTNVGDGAASPEETIGLYSYRAGGERPVQNPFRSVAQTSGGGCSIARTPSSFGDYHSATCSVGGLGPGQSTTIVATIEINESMDLSSIGNDVVTTLVDAPPEVSGSKQVKVGGLPRGCAASDFKLSARAKGAKKVTAALHGPLTVEGKPENSGEGFAKKLATANGPKLTARVGAGDLPPAYYGIKLAAKYEDRPKQKASVLFQAC
jgi:hypothetical protein